MRDQSPRFAPVLPVWKTKHQRSQLLPFAFTRAIKHILSIHSDRQATQALGGGYLRSSEPLRYFLVLLSSRFSCLTSAGPLSAPGLSQGLLFLLSLLQIPLVHPHGFNQYPSQMSPRFPSLALTFHPLFRPVFLNVQKIYREDISLPSTSDTSGPDFIISPPRRATPGPLLTAAQALNIQLLGCVSAVSPFPLACTLPSSPQ